MKYLILGTLAALICGCTSDRLGQLNPGAQIPYIVVTGKEMRVLAPNPSPSQFYHGLFNGKTIYQHVGASSVTGIHELGHLADRMGDYHAAFRAIQPKGTPSPEMLAKLCAMARVLQVADKLAMRHGEPLALWQAIKNTHGVEAIGGHIEILRKLK